MSCIAASLRVLILIPKYVFRALAYMYSTPQPSIEVRRQLEISRLSHRSHRGGRVRPPRP